MASLRRTVTGIVGRTIGLDDILILQRRSREHVRRIKAGVLVVGRKERDVIVRSDMQRTRIHFLGFLYVANETAF